MQLNSPFLKKPDSVKLIKVLSEKFSYPEKHVSLIYNELYPSWSNFASVEEFLSIIAFGLTYYCDGQFAYKVLKSTLADIGGLLNDEARLRELHTIGINGILDLDKVDSDFKLKLTADAVGVPITAIAFMKALSNDQINESKSIFIKAIDLLAAQPID